MSLQPLHDALPISSRGCNASIAQGLKCLWVLIPVSNIGHLSVAEAAAKCEITPKIKQNRINQTLPIDTRVPDRFRLFPLLAFVEILWALLTDCNHARFSGPSSFQRSVHVEFSRNLSSSKSESAPILKCRSISFLSSCCSSFLSPSSAQ